MDQLRKDGKVRDWKSLCRLPRSSGIITAIISFNQKTFYDETDFYSKQFKTILLFRIDLMILIGLQSTEWDIRDALDYLLHVPVILILMDSQIEIEKELR